MKKYTYQILTGVTGTTSYQIPIFLEASVDEMGVMVGFDGDIEQVEQFCNFTYKSGNPIASPTPTPSVTSTPSVTPTRTLTPTVTPSISVSGTPGASPTSTPSGTPTPTLTPTRTPTITPTPSPVEFRYYVDLYYCAYPYCTTGLGSTYISNTSPLTPGNFYCYDSNTIMEILGETSETPIYYTSFTTGYGSCDDACTNCFS